MICLNIVKKKISENIFLLEFDNQLEITSTLLRFQEYYESPEFRNKVFTLEEYKEWYSKAKGSFSYYVDWNGFNMPSYVLEPFYDGRFDPLSDQEKQVLELFKYENDKFYVISIHKDMEDTSKLLRHEIAHGLFYVDEDYRKEVTNILSKFDTTKIKEELRPLAGYHEDVLDDEVHAHLIDSKSIGKDAPEELKTQLKEIFENYLEKNKIKF